MACVSIFRMFSRTQLSDQVGWQDLKDLFRQAGNIVRADIDKDEAGQPAGSGYVVFDNANDARNAKGAYLR